MKNITGNKKSAAVHIKTNQLRRRLISETKKQRISRYQYNEKNITISVQSVHRIYPRYSLTTKAFGSDIVLE